MYPLSLELQYSKLWKDEVSRFAKQVNSVILKGVQAYSKEARADSYFFEPVVRLDVSDLRILLGQLKSQYGDFAPRKEFESQIKRNVQMIDAWSRDKTNSFIGKQYESMNSPRAGVVGGDRSAFRVPAIPISQKESTEVWNRVNQMIKEQSSLASNAFREHFDRVQKIVTDGLSKGLKYQDIASQIQNATGISERRAEFWAKDQTGKFFSQQSRFRQTKAGFPGYYWRSQKDSRVRDTHAHVADKFYTWDSPPLVNRKGGLQARLAPGDDYRCRCWAEPSWGPQTNKKQNTKNQVSIPKLILPSTSPTQTIVPISHSINLNLPDPTVHANIQKTISDLDSFLKFPKDRTGIGVHYLSGSMLKTNISGRFNPNANRIELNGSHTFKDTYQSTFVHEFGHMIDYSWIGQPGRYESTSTELSEFKSAVENTELYKRLKKIGMTGKIMLPGIQTVLLNQSQRKLIPYLISQEELFARAVELWTAKKTNSKNLIAQIRKKGNMNFVNHYWDEDDFESVNSALDNIFGKMGYLK
ncbi:phage protein F-like protein [Leptospira weilii str. 2006001853]|uniref:Phage protein F-like protein n=4 Tax=Leptospira weilii TaxID=28184 RepID=A0A828YWQ4_9LEPT|nr:phage minor head protein [Leptospira weilii]EMM73590.1 phage protein F-like protein [Leptospira weilii str. 2006001855]EKR62446.1 phage protein F-like protein [Leptospira weilii str. 2006001853]EKR64667.1 phage protein F-like protein [Leptospira weilii str. 2006001853]EKR66190.1 phage protein F-like protein [Leptospira weilii str. 2006001853]EMN92504.1 phage protein F-like protein [Leptospira weilii str. UI 13098]